MDNREEKGGSECFGWEILSSNTKVIVFVSFHPLNYWLFLSLLIMFFWAINYSFSQRSLISKESYCPRIFCFHLYIHSKDCSGGRSSVSHYVNVDYDVFWSIQMTKKFSQWGHAGLGIRAFQLSLWAISCFPLSPFPLVSAFVLFKDHDTQYNTGFPQLRIQ